MLVQPLSSKMMIALFWKLFFSSQKLSHETSHWRHFFFFFFDKKSCKLCRYWIWLSMMNRFIWVMTKHQKHCVIFHKCLIIEIAWSNWIENAWMFGRILPFVLHSLNVTYLIIMPWNFEPKVSNYLFTERVFFSCSSSLLSSFLGVPVCRFPCHYWNFKSYACPANL